VRLSSGPRHKRPVRCPHRRRRAEALLLASIEVTRPSRLLNQRLGVLSQTKVALDGPSDRSLRHYSSVRSSLSDGLHGVHVRRRATYINYDRCLES